MRRLGLAPLAPDSGSTAVDAVLWFVCRRCGGREFVLLDRFERDVAGDDLIRHGARMPREVRP